MSPGDGRGLGGVGVASGCGRGCGEVGVASGGSALNDSLLQSVTYIHTAPPTELRNMFLQKQDLQQNHKQNAEVRGQPDPESPGRRGQRSA